MLDAHTKLMQRLLTRELKSGLVSVVLERKPKQNSVVERGESGGKVLSLESLVGMYSSLE